MYAQLEQFSFLLPHSKTTLFYDLLSCLFICNIVEQEIFATGNFRDFRPQAIRVQENFENFWSGELTNDSVQDKIA